MIEEEIDLEETSEQPETRKPPFLQMAKLFFKPRQTFAWLAEQTRPMWFWPLFILSLAVLVSNLLMMPVRGRASGDVTMTGPNAEWMTDDQKQQITQAASAKTGILFTLIFPVLAGVLGVWFGWVILSSILQLGLTLMGSRASGIFNMTAFASLPLILRSLVSGLATLVTGKVSIAPGLSGFVSQSSNPVLHAFLGSVDLYFLWQLALLMLGAVIFSKLPKPKAWLTVAFCVLLVLVLQSLPALLASKMSGVNMNGGGMMPY